MRDTLQDQEYTTLSRRDCRQRRAHRHDGGSLRGKNLLITDRINYGVGRPGLVDASATGDITRLGDVWMQFGAEGRTHQGARQAVQQVAA